MAVFKTVEEFVTAFRAPEDITVDYPTPVVVAKNDWFVRRADGTIESWEHDDFLGCFEAVDAEAQAMVVA